MKKCGVYGGIDVGNGFVKAGLRGSLNPEKKNLTYTIEDKISVSSTVGIVTRPNALPKKDAEASDICTDDLYNSLDLSFTTPLVPDQYRRLFGSKGLSSDVSSVDTFDIVGNTSKAEQPLSAVIVLGMVAAKALKDYVEAEKKLPAEQLQVEAHVGLALPINEYLRHKDRYVTDLTSTDHLVTVHMFETPVSVKLSFGTVEVLPEGFAAQYAITHMGENLMDALLADVRSRGLALEGITSADVMAAQNIIGIDIGEGTVNFLVITGGNFNIEASRTLTKGYGTVLEGALKAMEDRGVHTSFTTRKHIAEFLLAGPSPLKRAFYAEVERFVEEEKEFFAREVTEFFGRVLASVGAVTEVAYVYGGGSGPMQEILYPLLQAKVTEINSEGAFPVFYLDAAYSRNLNRKGLSFAAAQAFTRGRKKG